MNAPNPGMWFVGLRGGLSVVRPDGTPVHFKARKVGAVFAMLALRNGQPLSRDEIGDALWLNVAPHRRGTNLRQAIALLRKTLGVEMPVVVTRQTLRMVMERVTCPELDSDLPGDVLLPEMSEPWFGAARRRFAGHAGFETAADREGASLDRAAAGSLIRVLEWSRESRPHAVLEIVKAAPELAQAAPPAELIRILDTVLATVRATEPLFGWGLCQRAIALGMVGQVDRALAQLLAAKDHAIAHRDRNLFVEACFYHAGFQIVLGQTGEAVSALREALALRLGKGSRAATIRLRHGLGLALIHAGAHDEGFAQFRTAIAIFDDQVPPFERAYLLANLAWMESTCGRIEQVDEHVAEARRLVGDSSFRIVVTCLLAEAALGVSQGGEVDLLARQVISIAEQYDSASYEVYGRELLALAAWRRDEREEALRQRDLARLLREGLGYQLTAWDRQRLGPLQDA